MKFIADITQVLNTEIFLLKKDPSSQLTMERLDLSEVFPPYLLVRGLEDWEMLKKHFKAEAQGAKGAFTKEIDNS